MFTCMVSQGHILFDSKSAYLIVNLKVFIIKFLYQFLCSGAYMVSQGHILFDSKLEKLIVNLKIFNIKYFFNSNVYVQGLLWLYFILL